jgi:hypothetical protein
MLTHPTGILATDGDALEIGYEVVFFQFEGVFRLVRDSSDRRLVMAPPVLETLRHSEAHKANS